MGGPPVAPGPRSAQARPSTFVFCLEPARAPPALQDGQFQSKEYEFKLQVPAKDGKLVTVGKGTLDLAQFASARAGQEAVVPIAYLNKQLRGAPDGRLRIGGEWSARRFGASGAAASLGTGDRTTWRSSPRCPCVGRRPPSTPRFLLR